MMDVERNDVDNDEFVMTWTAARDLVQSVENAFGAADLKAIEAGFSADAIARFADFPEMRGRPAIMAFMTARFARTLGYKLTKTLQAVTGNRNANTWDASWTDAKTGKKMLGRGTEIWVMHGRRIAVWDATFNAWEEGGAPTTPVI